MANTITLRVDDGIYNIVDDNEMNEILAFKKDLKKGLSDIKPGRYKIIKS
jgi:hypothetical protein